MTTFTSYVPVAGTWASRRTGEWSEVSSPFSGFLQQHGCANLCAKADVPFEWTTNLDLFPPRHDDWKAGGAALFYFIVPPLHPEFRVPPEETVVITHSHGLQVALYAAAMGLKIDRLIDVAGPVRKDMMDVAKTARPNIRRWLHLHSDFSDRMQWLGELFDGHFGIVREHPLADENDGVRKVGHGGLLRDPNDFHFWGDRGWLTFLTTAPAAMV